MVKRSVECLDIGALDTNRTCDLPLRRGLLYPLSYEGDARGFYPISVASRVGGALRFVAAIADEPLSRNDRIGPESTPVFRRREGARDTASIMAV